MKILLSAYACEPNKGSEPAVGWNWAVELAKNGHEVWVITRDNNRDSIEQAVSSLDKNIKLRFVYVGVPKYLSFWKRKSFGIHQYYFLWQVAAFLRAKALHQYEQFDLVHHVTFVSIRQPSFMGLLGIPFIFGPVAGGDTIPLALRKSFTLKERLYESARDIINAMIKADPFMHLTFHCADKIYVNSEQSQSLVPAQYKHKVEIQLAIAYNASSSGAVLSKSVACRKLLYVGNLLHLKGIHLAIKAFVKILEKYPDSTFTIVGSGPKKSDLQKLAANYGVSQSVFWLDFIPRDELLRKYAEYDLFLFPSLRDSGGLVVFEAMAAGLPVVTLKLGGPGIIVDESCGISVPVESLDEFSVETALSKAVLYMMDNPGEYGKKISSLDARLAGFSWKKLVQVLYP